MHPTLLPYIVACRRKSLFICLCMHQQLFLVFWITQVQIDYSEMIQRVTNEQSIFLPSIQRTKHIPWQDTNGKVLVLLYSRMELSFLYWKAMVPHRLVVYWWWWSSSVHRSALYILSPDNSWLILPSVRLLLLLVEMKIN